MSDVIEIVPAASLLSLSSLSFGSTKEIHNTTNYQVAMRQGGRACCGCGQGESSHGRPPSSKRGEIAFAFSLPLSRIPKFLK
eukprot:scaffold179179_cov36-Tisochrysis_lutea.AAC.1